MNWDVIAIVQNNIPFRHQPCDLRAQPPMDMDSLVHIYPYNKEQAVRDLGTLSSSHACTVWHQIRLMLTTVGKVRGSSQCGQHWFIHTEKKYSQG